MTSHLQLPQPEETREMEWEDYWIDVAFQRKRDLSAALTRISELEQQLQTAQVQWNPIEQGPPRVGKLCLVVCNGYVQHIPYSRDGLGFDCEDGYEWTGPEFLDVDPIPDGEVSHWMYLPTAPHEPVSKRQGGNSDGK